MKEFKKSFGKKKFRTCRLRKKYGSMNFSYEELYSMYGQYDAFIALDFHQGSEAYNKFGQSLMGTFKYTLEQREELEQLLKLKQKRNSQSNKNRRKHFRERKSYDDAWII